MIVYAAVEVNAPKLLLVTDEIEKAYAEIERVKRQNHGREVNYMVLDSNSLQLSPSAMSCASMEYDMERLAERVCIRLNARNLFENSFEQTTESIIPDITSEAYYRMTCCNADEETAIDAAIDLHLGITKTE